MRITKHSVDNYLERVFDLPHETAGEGIRDIAAERIEEVINNPDHIIREDGNPVPIHIKGDVAIPVAETHVPTTYHADTFKDRIKE